MLSVFLLGSSTFRSSSPSALPPPSSLVLILSFFSVPLSTENRTGLIVPQDTEHGSGLDPGSYFLFVIFFNFFQWGPSKKINPLSHPIYILTLKILKGEGQIRFVYNHRFYYLYFIPETLKGMKEIMFELHFNLKYPP